MKILLHYPTWGNRWIEYIEKELSQYDLTVCHSFDGGEVGKLSEKADILISMWANEVTMFWSQHFGDKKIITYLRRFEIWEKNLYLSTNFGNIDAIIFVADYYRRVFNEIRQDKPKPRLQFVLPNGVDLNEFPLRKKKPGSNKIAMVANIKNVKNIPLAAQILLNLPGGFEIHHVAMSVHTDQIAGQIISYLRNLGLQKRYIFNPGVPKDQVKTWLMDKDYVLSTSINEGNPNNVIEAMAMGIKPIIHNWPGALDQFPKDLVFNTVGEATEKILELKYEPERYRRIVDSKYSIDNFKMLHEVIRQVCGVS